MKHIYLILTTLFIVSGITFFWNDIKGLPYKVQFCNKTNLPIDIKITNKKTFFNQKENSFNTFSEKIFYDLGPEECTKSIHTNIAQNRIEVILYGKIKDIVNDYEGESLFPKSECSLHNGHPQKAFNKTFGSYKIDILGEVTRNYPGYKCELEVELEKI